VRPGGLSCAGASSRPDSEDCGFWAPPPSVFGSPNVQSSAASTKPRLTSVAVCALCTSIGTTALGRPPEELPDPPDPLPNSAVPITAIPMAAPSRWAVISAPPAVPACARGTSESTKSWFGAITRPFPSPASSSGPVSAKKPGCVPDSHSTSSTSAWPASMPQMPAWMAFRPNRRENR